MPCVLRVRLAACCRGAVSFATRRESSKGFLVGRGFQATGRGSVTGRGRSAGGLDRTAVPLCGACGPHCARFHRTAVDFGFSHRTALDFTAVRSFPPAVRKRSAVELDRTGAAQCASPSNRAPPSCLETPSYSEYSIDLSDYTLSRVETADSTLQVRPRSGAILSRVSASMGVFFFVSLGGL